MIIIHTFAAGISSSSWNQIDGLRSDARDGVDGTQKYQT
jgi:hypothetical protein